MTLREFYSDVLKKTEGMEFAPMAEIPDLSALCYELIRIQLSKEVLEELSFEKEKNLYYEVFSGFNPKAILRRGQYLSQLNYVLETFLPSNITPYKKLAQTVFLSAKALSRFSSLDDFVKEVSSQCPEKDDRKTFDFLSGFRLTFGLPSMFFNTTCLFFSRTGLLDVPYLTKDIKRILFEKLTMEEDNASFFHILSLLMKISDSCGYEVSQRLERYSLL